MDIGKLQVNVFTSRGKIPVADATVLISRGKNDVIALEVTNRSGQTREITVPTPPDSTSSLPTKGMVSTLVDVWVEHPNFVTQKLQNVQLFPDTVTILPIELQPLGEDASSLVEEVDVELSLQDL